MACWECSGALKPAMTRLQAQLEVMGANQAEMLDAELGMWRMIRNSVAGWERLTRAQLAHLVGVIERIAVQKVRGLEECQNVSLPPEQSLN